MKNLARNRISDTKNSVDTFGSLQHALTNEYQSKMRKKKRITLISFSENPRLSRIQPRTKGWRGVSLLLEPTTKNWWEDPDVVVA